MREIVKKAMKVLEFDLVAETSSIEARFLKIHNWHLSRYPQWSSTATRQLLISDYWFNVFKHYSALIILPFIIAIAYAGTMNVYFLAAVFIFLLIGFGCLYIAMYRRVYTLEYLPYVETITARYQNEKQQAIINGLKEELQTVTFQFQQYREDEQQKREKLLTDVIRREKAATEKLLQAKEIQESGDLCRKKQYRTFTLTLIFQALRSSYFESELKSAPRTLTSLNKLFGVAPNGLRDCIDIINGVNGTRDKVKDKNFTYKREDFDDARAFLEEWGCNPALEQLGYLEKAILQRKLK